MSTSDRRRRQNRRRERQRLKQEERSLQSQGEHQNQPTFAVPTTTEPCPDCHDRALQGFDGLRYMHRPRRMAFPLLPRAVLHDLGCDPGSKEHVHCETCDGNGYLSTLPRLDPYDMNDVESKRAAERLQLWRLRTPPSS